MFCKSCRIADVLTHQGINERYCGYCHKLHTLDQFVGKLRVCVLKQQKRLENEKRRRRKIDDEIILIDIKTLWNEKNKKKLWLATKVIKNERSILHVFGV
jgi:hypothetical protein